MQASVILRLPPLPLPPAAPGGVSIHVLTSSQDWLMALWMLRSFFHYSPARLPVVIHDDGTLTGENRAAIQQSLPGAVLVSRAEADAKAEAQLAAHPRCRAMRRENNLMLKVFDPWICSEAEGVLLLDSDVLFFSQPTEIWEWIASPKVENRWNEDIANAYTIPLHDMERMIGVPMTERINSGLGLVSRRSIDFDLVEEALRHPAAASIRWRAEQTVYAILSSRFGTRLLPHDYLIDVNPRSPLPEGVVCRHYVGAVRGLFYGQGLPTLRQALFGS